jgi:hypothetical protein
MAVRFAVALTLDLAALFQRLLLWRDHVVDLGLEVGIAMAMKALGRCRRPRFDGFQLYFSNVIRL